MTATGEAGVALMLGVGAAARARDTVELPERGEQAEWCRVERG